jgi:hypothetical protein
MKYLALSSNITVPVPACVPSPLSNLHSLKNNDYKHTLNIPVLKVLGSIKSMEFFDYTRNY